MESIAITTQSNLHLPEIRRCLRQPPNILRFLNSRSTYSTKKCHKPVCKICDVILERKHGIKIGNKQVNFNANMNCCSKNIIYVIFCDSCGLFYVGHTVCELRIYTHNILISEHIRKCGVFFSIIPIYQALNSCEYVLSYLEKTFIHSLEPTLC